MDRFPERIDSQRIFASNGLIQGEVPVAALPRLGEYLSRPGGLVQVDLQFGHDDQRRRILSGTLDVTVVMQCQHCLEDVDIRLQPIIALRIVSTDVEARQLPGEFESVVVEGESLELLALLEDELILSLPLVPRHQFDHCNEYLKKLETNAGAGKPEISPFAGLKDLKLGKPGEKPGRN